MLQYKKFGLFWAAVVLPLFSLPTFAQELSLVVNPVTGEVSLQNGYASAVDINGYLLTADQNLFDPNGWDSFANDPNSSWAEIQTAANRVGETNLLSSTVIGAGATIDLGVFYNPFSHTAIGQVEPTFNFQYHPIGGSTQTGIVQFTPQNNVVLVVDPNTGDAVLQNQSAYDVSINGYLITSEANVLDPNGWSPGAMGASWAATHSAPNRLGELNLLGSSFVVSGGGAVSIGSAIDPLLLDHPDDLLFEYHIAGGSTTTGGIFLGEVPSIGSADFDSSGLVDGLDFLKWQRGETSEGGSAAELQLWESTYGNAGSVATVQAVPEPSSFLLLTFGAFGLCRRSRRWLAVEFPKIQS